VDEIARAQTVADLTHWNFHLPKRANVRVTADTELGKNVIELRDAERWDHAQAERIFPAGSWLRLRFRMQVRAFGEAGRCEIDVQSQRHERPAQLCVSAAGMSIGGTCVSARFDMQRWHDVEIVCRCDAQCFTVRIDDTIVCADAPFAEPAARVERVVFRTGPWRGLVPPELVDGGIAIQELIEGDDVADDTPTTPAVFWITEVGIETK
jgi:hypothetical protein